MTTTAEGKIVPLTRPTTPRSVPWYRKAKVRRKAKTRLTLAKSSGNPSTHFILRRVSYPFGASPPSAPSLRTISCLARSRFHSFGAAMGNENPCGCGIVWILDWQNLNCLFGDSKCPRAHRGGAGGESIHSVGRVWWAEEAAEFAYKCTWKCDVKGKVTYVHVFGRPLGTR